MSIRPKTNKERLRSKNTGRRNDPPWASGPWGRAASPYRPGLFTRQYFDKHGEACAAEIYEALSREIERLNAERAAIGETVIRRPNYGSFSRYFHWFLIMGLIRRTGRQEPAIYDFLHERVFYKLTTRGEKEQKAWGNPVQAARDFRLNGGLDTLSPEIPDQ